MANQTTPAAPARSPFSLAVGFQWLFLAVLYCCFLNEHGDFWTIFNLLAKATDTSPAAGDFQKQVWQLHLKVVEPIFKSHSLRTIYIYSI